MIPWYDQSIGMLLGFSVSQVWVFFTPILAGAFGAWITRWFRKKDDREARRRDLVGSKIEEAYVLVCEALEHPGMDQKEAFHRKLKLERAINTIDLYGDIRARESAKAIAVAFARGDSWVSYEPLMTALRDVFRKSFGLEALSEPVKTLKFGISSNATEPNK